MSYREYVFVNQFARPIQQKVLREVRVTVTKKSGLGAKQKQQLTGYIRNFLTFLNSYRYDLDSEMGL
jgi:hypothetical protein